MPYDPKQAGHVLLLRGAALTLLAALVLAWCLVGLDFGLPFAKAIFPGKFTRVLQAHLDFLIMSALILGFYGARISLTWHVRWAMVIGSFTNPSLFLAQGMFRVLDLQEPQTGLLPTVFFFFIWVSLLTASYGFGKGAVTVLKSTFETGSPH